MDIYMTFYYLKQKTAYEISTSDWSSDVCSSDLAQPVAVELAVGRARDVGAHLDLPRHHVQIGRASCRERGVDLGGRRFIKKKLTHRLAWPSGSDPGQLNPEGEHGGRRG